MAAQRAAPTDLPEAPGGAASIAAQLRRAINEGKYGYRERLPAERDLAKHFGASRSTVREALRFLELQGALRIKAGPGGGPVVSVPGADHLASVLSLHLQFAEASFRSVVDARCSLYPVLAAEAAENASREDVRMLQASIARVHAAVQDPEFFTSEARRFMSLLAATSRNRVLALLVEMPVLEWATPAAASLFVPLLLAVSFGQRSLGS